MKQYMYRVKFRGGGYEDVLAFNENEAMTLARAERIKKGLFCTVSSWWLIE